MNSQSSFRDLIIAYSRGGLGQKQQYAPKSGGAAGPYISRYTILPGGNCRWQGTPTRRTTQDALAAQVYGTSSNLTFDQLGSLFNNAPVPVQDTNGASGWFIGDGVPTPSTLGPRGGCNDINLSLTAWYVATPDGDLVPIPAGVYSPGMKWNDLVQPLPAGSSPPPPPGRAPTPPNTGGGGGGILNTPTLLNLAAQQQQQQQQPTCSAGYQLPPPGRHITCLPGYGWIADAAGCEQCVPLCASGWLPPDQAPSQCAAGEVLITDPRTRCVKCVQGSNCFAPGQNPIPCSDPFVLEARGNYQCCVIPTQQSQQSQQASLAPSAPTPAASTASTGALSMGAKIAIGAGALLLIGAIFSNSKGRA